MNDEEKTSEKGGAGRGAEGLACLISEIWYKPRVSRWCNRQFCKGGQFCVLRPRTSEPVRRKLTHSPTREPKRYPLRP